MTLFDELKYKIKPFSEIVDLHEGKLELTNTEYENLKKLFVKWDEKIKKDKYIYYESDWEEFFAKDGKLISKPPWGSIISIKISDGSVNWKKPFGYQDETEIGLFNSGGASITTKIFAKD